jgi:hypothetical protein
VLAIGNEAGELSFWETLPVRFLGTLRGLGTPHDRSARVHAVAFSPDGQTLAVASQGTLRLWPWRRLLEA